MRRYTREPSPPILDRDDSISRRRSWVRLCTVLIAALPVCAPLAASGCAKVQPPAPSEPTAMEDAAPPEASPGSAAAPPPLPRRDRLRLLAGGDVSLGR